mgnify:CR=1 FL=1
MPGTDPRGFFGDGSAFFGGVASTNCGTSSATVSLTRRLNSSITHTEQRFFDLVSAVRSVI